MSVDDDAYDPFDPDTPRVQIPLGRDKLGLTIDGEFYPHYELPDEARKALLKYVKGGGRPGGIGQTDVHMCEECADRDDGFEVGYLTTSDNIGDYRNPYQCSHEWRSEGFSVNGTTIGRFAPNPWRLQATVNGDSSRVITDEDAPRTYALRVMKRDRYHADAETIDETTVEFPDMTEGDEATASGVTDGQRWEVEITVRSSTVDINWRLLDENGDVPRYAYVETDGMQHQNPNKELGYLPLDEYDLNGEGSPIQQQWREIGREYDVDGETVKVKEMSTEFSSHHRKRECGSTDFKRVYPGGTLVNDEDLIPVHDLSADEVPNTKAHLSRIQGQLSDSMSRDQMLQTVAESVAAFRERHGIDN